MFFRFFGSCSSCNRPPLPDWLIAFALVFMTIVSGMLFWMAFSTIFS